jgi:competence protein ComEA
LDTGNGSRAAAPAAREETARARGAETRETESAPAGDDRLNLNTASRGQLMRLPRIGAQAADRIIAFREENGPIRNVRQLRQAEVIPVSAARQIRELVQF